MYEQFFGFREPPFRTTPDPRFLHRTAQHVHAIAALGDAVAERRAAALVGEIGTGKTTVVRAVLEALPPGLRTVVLASPRTTPDDAVEQLLRALAVPERHGVRPAARLVRWGREQRRCAAVVVLDEAQAAPIETLDLLASLSTVRARDGGPAFAVLLAGQPELDAKLTAMSQAVAVRVHLVPLATDDVAAYVAARLACAGTEGHGPFTAEAIARLGVHSAGVPRVVNVLADTALAQAFAFGVRRVTARMVDEAAATYAPLTPEGVPMPGVPRPPPGAPPVVLPHTAPGPRRLGDLGGVLQQAAAAAAVVFVAATLYVLSRGSGAPALRVAPPETVGAGEVAGVGSSAGDDEVRARVDAAGAPRGEAGVAGIGASVAPGADATPVALADPARATAGGEPAAAARAAAEPLAGAESARAAATHAGAEADAGPVTGAATGRGASQDAGLPARAAVAPFGGDAGRVAGTAVPEPADAASRIGSGSLDATTRLGSQPFDTATRAASEPLDAATRAADSAPDEPIATASVAGATRAVPAPAATAADVRPLTATDALAVLDAYRDAWERGDVAALRRIIADDARLDEGRGAEAEIAAYLGRLSRARSRVWTQPAAEVRPLGTAVEVSGPFVASWRTPRGTTERRSGLARWVIARRDGAPRVVVLERRLDPVRR